MQFVEYVSKNIELCVYLHKLDNGDIKTHKSAIYSNGVRITFTSIKPLLTYAVRLHIFMVIDYWDIHSVIIFVYVPRISRLERGVKKKLW